MKSKLSVHIKWLVVALILVIISSIITVQVIDSKINIRTIYGAGTGKEVSDALGLGYGDSGNWVLYGSAYKLGETKWFTFAMMWTMIINIITMVIFYLILSRKISS